MTKRSGAVSSRAPVVTNWNGPVDVKPMGEGVKAEAAQAGAEAAKKMEAAR